LTVYFSGRLISYLTVRLLEGRWLRMARRVLAHLPMHVRIETHCDSRYAADYRVGMHIRIQVGTGWDDIAGADPRRRGLASEAIELGRLLRRMLPGEPEAQGLLALMLHCEARREARRSAAGAYVPLSKQNPAQWSRPMIREAEELLTTAAQARRTGRFQLEAAIQSVHARRAVTGKTDWEAIAVLYEGLVRMAPTVGASVGRAAAVAEARGAAEGWALLGEIPADASVDYQPYWAVTAHLLVRLGRTAEAASAYDRAIGLSQDPATRDFLVARKRESP
jgi:RNA polymerase sigma-70 factor (ECF subfamily)